MPAIGGLNFQPNPPSAVSGFGNQAYQQFSYMSQVNNPSGGQNGTFTFPVPPQGYVWIGTFMPTIAQSVTANPGNEPIISLSFTTWQINRNGQAVASWVGFTTLTNFQANPTDTITVTAFNLPAGPFTLTWIGYAYPTSLAPPVLPSFNTSGYPQTVIQPANTIVMSGTVPAGATSFFFNATLPQDSLLLGFDLSAYWLWTGAPTQFCATTLVVVNVTTGAIVFAAALVGEPDNTSVSVAVTAGIYDFGSFPLLMPAGTYSFQTHETSCPVLQTAAFEYCALYVTPY